MTSSPEVSPVEVSRSKDVVVFEAATRHPWSDLTDHGNHRELQPLT